MKVKAGYKQTEVGIIPQDWEVRPLETIGIFKNGINKGKGDFGHGFPFVNLMDVFGIPKISVVLPNLGLVNTNEKEKNLYSLKGGDVLFVRSSVMPKGVGLTTLIPTDLPDTVFSGFLIRFRDSGHINYAFKEHCFFEASFRSRLISSSTVSANTNINQDALKKLLIVLPPTKEEQNTIATTLSDVDALVDALDRLIAKKRNLKQAAMQQLLTGETRLPGFKNDWELDYIEKIAHVTTGSKNTQDSVEEGEYPFFVRSQTVERINSYSFDGEAVLTAGDGVGTGKVYHYINGKFEVHQRVYRISDFCERVNGYFFFLYFSWNFYHRIMQMTAKSSVDSVRLEMITRMRISLPTKEEQTAIASILSDMDSEITALEKRRAKTASLKQALMQELLTGKTRLVKAGALHA